MPDSTGHRKRIIAIRNASSFDFGGGERFPVDISNVLKDLGYQVRIVSRNSKLLKYAQQQNIPTTRGWWWSRQDWGGWRNILMPVYLFWQCLLFFWYVQLFLRIRPDVIHIQSRDDFISATLAGRLLGKRIIWTDHADLKYIYANHSQAFKNIIGKLVYCCSHLAHAVTLVSDNEKKLISKSLKQPVPSNYRVIHNGVSQEEIIPVPRDPNYKKDVIFACTSRLVTSKGIGELIRAFVRTQARHSNARLFLFGEGPEEVLFREMAKDSDRIHFKGFPADSLNQVADCDVFVHPSYHEGFSISLVEAAKLGLPIIACPVGGNTEIVKNNVNGLLVSVKSVDNLADAMLLLAKDKSKRLAFGKAARNSYEQEFVLETIVQKEFVPLYE